MKEVRSAYAHSLIGLLLLVGCGVHGFSRPPSSHRRLSSFQRTRAPRSMLPDRRPTIRAPPPSRSILRSEPEPNSESTSRRESSNHSPTPNDGLLEALRDATIEASREALSALRWGAACALTKSLPPKRRDELLSRMGRDDPEGRTAAAAPTIREERGSVQEEIAAAVAEETRRDKEKWEKEKERMAQRMEDAVHERVANEIAVQTKRLEEEQKERIEEAESERRRLEAETKELKERLDDRVVAKVESGGNELEETESLLRKRERQRAELDAVEENLRKRVREIELKKARLTELMEEVEGASVQHATATAETSDGVPDDALPHYSPKEYRNLSGEDKAKLKSQREAMGQTSTTEAIDDDAAHPILGPVVSDLGYKRVHLVPSGKLGTIPIWNRNRIYRHDRAKSMAIDKSKTMHLGFPGVVCLHEDKDGKLSILDGQHRVGMMAALREKRNEEAEALGKTEIAAEAADDDDMFDRILVEVYPQPPHSDVASDEHAEEVFVEINKSEPIKLLDMPGVASYADRKLITDAVSNLQRRYPQMFSPSQKCRVPNVNVDNLRNSIFGADILNRHKLKSSKQLFDWLLVQNAVLGGEYATDDDRRSIVNAKAWRKASSNDFYLGLRSSWLYK